MTEPQLRYRHAPGVEVNELADGLVLYRASDDSVHHLNPTASLVYDLCDGQTHTELVDAVAVVLQRPNADVAPVVTTAAAQLAEIGLVRPATRPEQAAGDVDGYPFLQGAEPR